MTNGDRLDRAGWFILVLVLAALLLPATAAVVGRLGYRDNLDAVRALGLDVPSFVPSGRILRSPYLRHRGVDLRRSPRMPNGDPDPARLIVPWRSNRP